MRPIKYGLKMLLALGAMVYLTRCTPSHWDKAAEGAYAAELQLCVANARTLEESKECRRQVDTKWGVAGVAGVAGGNK
jgi:hypothetical protein